MGKYNGLPDKLTENIAQLVRDSGIQVEVETDLDRAKWEKLIWNIPFNGLGVAGAAGLDAVKTGSLKPNNSIGQCLTSADLLDKGIWESRVTELMDEGISTGRA